MARRQLRIRQALILMDCILCGGDVEKGANQQVSALKRIKLDNEVVSWQQAEYSGKFSLRRQQFG